MDYALSAFAASTSTPTNKGIDQVCDVITPLTDFNATAYMGVWYEQDHVTHQPFQFDSWTCTQAVYTDL